MSASSTSKPSPASRIAIARPIPDAAPVTMALRWLMCTFLSVPILPGCPVSHSSPTACSTRTRRRTAAPAARGVYSPLVEEIRAKGWRIEQMPCPELAFTGLHRFWAVKEQLDTSAYRRHCRRLAAAVAGAVEVHVDRGDDVILVGIEGSPSMGVHITSSDPNRGGRPEWPDGREELSPGSGIFMEELTAELADRGVEAPRAMGISHQLPDSDPAAERARAGRADGRLSGRRRTRVRVALVAGRAAQPRRRQCRRAGGAGTRADWGAIQLPAADYPDEVAGPLLEQVAEQAEEFVRHGYPLALVGRVTG